MTDNRKDTSLVITTDSSVTKRSSALVRRGLETLGLHNFYPRDKSGGNSGPPRPNEGKTQSIYEALAELLEKEGSVAEVGPDYYADFVNLNDDEIASLIRLVIIASEKELNRMLLDKERKFADPDLVKFIKNSLWAIAHGWLRFGEEDGKLYMFKPDGPEPTSEMAQLIDDRINRTEPQIGPAFIDLVTKSVKNST